MNFINKNILIILFGLVLIKVSAQADPQYTQYMYNAITLNPGYTGSNDGLEALLLHRSQWTGIEGSPQTQSFSLHKRFLSKVGLGLSALNDNKGPSNNIIVNGNIAYHLPVGYNLKLSLGINAGVDLLNIDWSKGSFFEAGDPLFSENINSARPILGSGLYLYSNKWYVGVSASNFFNSTLYNDEERVVTDRKTQYYGIAGYVFNLSYSVSFKPTVLVKKVAGAPISYDISANFRFLERFSAGIGYRNDMTLSALAGFQVGPKFFMGYAYDNTRNGLSEYTSGSHEIILRYSIPSKNSKAISPRFF